MNVVRSFKENLNPTDIYSDFEQEFIGVFLALFANTNIKFCHFHFTQSLYGHVQSCGLQIVYAEDINFNNAIKMTVALAFLPIHDVIYSYDTLLNCEYFSYHE